MVVRRIAVKAPKKYFTCLRKASLQICYQPPTRLLYTFHKISFIGNPCKYCYENSVFCPKGMLGFRNKCINAYKCINQFLVEDVLKIQ